MRTIKNKKRKGFTLIELLVSVSLFSVVLVVTLGSIVTIADSNKKARSLMSVMNNLNFAVDSMTRSLKSGKINSPATRDGGRCVTTQQIDYNSTTGEFDRVPVEYCLEVDANGIGRIDKNVNGDIQPLTAPDVDIDYLKFTAYVGLKDQPRISIVLEGTVKVSEKISSKFSIQTTVAQRQLNI